MTNELWATSPLTLEQEARWRREEELLHPPKPKKKHARAIGDMKIGPKPVVLTSRDQEILDTGKTTMVELRRKLPHLSKDDIRTSVERLRRAGKI